MANETAYSSQYVSYTATMQDGSTETGYSTTALFDRKPDVIWRSDDKVDTCIKIDRGASPVACDTIALINHNLSGGTLYLTTSAADVYGTATLRATITIASTDINHPIWFDFITSNGYRYWWLNFTDDDGTRVGSATSSDDYFKLGQLFAGVKTNMTQRCAPLRESGPNWLSTRHVMHNGAIRRVQRGLSGRVLTLEWSAVNSTTKTELETLYRQKQGDRYPFLFIPDVDTTDETRAWYGHFSRPMTIVHLSENLYTITTEFTEEAMG